MAINFRNLTNSNTPKKTVVNTNTYSRYFNNNQNNNNHNSNNQNQNLSNNSSTNSFSSKNNFYQNTNYNNNLNSQATQSVGEGEYDDPSFWNAVDKIEIDHQNNFQNTSNYSPKQKPKANDINIPKQIYGNNNKASSNFQIEFNPVNRKQKSTPPSFSLQQTQTVSNATNSSGYYKNGIPKAANPKKFPTKKKEIQELFSELQNRKIEGDEIPFYDQEAIKTALYPNNYEVRDYQYSIVETALMNNTMVSLPTGLGKTLIAAVVMCNFFRWFPGAKVVFMAPTKPLVDQQIDACHQIMGIPHTYTTKLTGQIKADKRKELWRDKRVFFGTPQTIENDIDIGNCDPGEIVCIVVDEAHKAAKKYSYVSVVEQIAKRTNFFRILGLSATPGTNIAKIQNIFYSLRISSLESRSDDDPDVKKYIHETFVEHVRVSASPEVLEVKKKFEIMLKPIVERLNEFRVCHFSDPKHGSKNLLFSIHKNFKDDPSGIPESRRPLVHGEFGAALAFYSPYDQLKTSGIDVCYEKLLEIEETEKTSVLSKAKQRVIKSKEFLDLKNTCKRIKEQPNYSDHPKMGALKEIIIQHFRIHSPNDSRVIIFASLRIAVSVITSILNELPDHFEVRAKEFTGQGTSAQNAPTMKSKGQNQKTQKKVLDSFKDGTYNTLVSTSIGEEGLDIGSVDLVIFFDSPNSSTRQTQRKGRTGRKREGRCVMLLTEGEEEKTQKSTDSKTKTIGRKMENRAFVFFTDKNPIIPRHINPKIEFHHMTVDEWDFNLNLEKKKRKISQISKSGKIEDFHPSQQEKKRKYVTENGYGISTPEKKKLKLNLCAFPSFQTQLTPIDFIEHSSKSKCFVNSMRFIQNEYQQENYDVMFSDQNHNDTQYTTINHEKKFEKKKKSRINSALIYTPLYDSADDVDSDEELLKNPFEKEEDKKENKKEQEEDSLSRLNKFQAPKLNKKKIQNSEKKDEDENIIDAFLADRDFLSNSLPPKNLKKKKKIIKKQKNKISEDFNDINLSDIMDFDSSVLEKKQINQNQDNFVKTDQENTFFPSFNIPSQDDIDMIQDDNDIPDFNESQDFQNIYADQIMISDSSDEEEKQDLNNFNQQKDEENKPSPFDDNNFFNNDNDNTISSSEEEEEEDVPVGILSNNSPLKDTDIFLDTQQSPKKQKFKRLNKKKNQNEDTPSSCEISESPKKQKRAKPKLPNLKNKNDNEKPKPSKKNKLFSVSHFDLEAELSEEDRTEDDSNDVSELSDDFSDENSFIDDGEQSEESEDANDEQFALYQQSLNSQVDPNTINLPSPFKKSPALKKSGKFRMTGRIGTNSPKKIKLFSEKDSEDEDSQDSENYEKSLESIDESESPLKKKQIKKKDLEHDSISESDTPEKIAVVKKRLEFMNKNTETHRKKIKTKEKLNELKQAQINKRKKQANDQIMEDSVGILDAETFAANFFEEPEIILPTKKNNQMSNQKYADTTKKENISNNYNKNTNNSYPQNSNQNQNNIKNNNSNNNFNSNSMFNQTNNANNNSNKNTNNSNLHNSNQNQNNIKNSSSNNNFNSNSMYNQRNNTNNNYNNSNSSTIPQNLNQNQNNISNNNSSNNNFNSNNMYNQRNNTNNNYNNRNSNNIIPQNLNQSQNSTKNNSSNNNYTNKSAQINQSIQQNPKSQFENMKNVNKPPVHNQNEKKNEQQITNSTEDLQKKQANNQKNSPKNKQAVLDSFYFSTPEKKKTKKISEGKS